MTLDEPIWAALHGDSARSKIWAVLTDEGRTFDLTGWSVFAQARDDEDDTSPLWTWSVGDGVDIGVAEVQVKDRHVKTSTIQLYLRPADFANLPRRYAGVVDVEIVSDNSEDPEQRHTVVRFPFRIDPDVTRSG